MHDNCGLHSAQEFSSTSKRIDIKRHVVPLSHTQVPLSSRSPESTPRSPSHRPTSARPPSSPSVTPRKVKSGAGETGREKRTTRERSRKSRGEVTAVPPLQFRLRAAPACLAAKKYEPAFDQHSKFRRRLLLLLLCPQRPTARRYSIYIPSGATGWCCHLLTREHIYSRRRAGVSLCFV